MEEGELSQDILIQAQQGNEAAITKVLKKYNGIVFHQARRQVEPGSTFFDDYMQEGRLAILSALHEADLSRKDGFYNFASNVTRSHMLKFGDQTTEIPWHHYTHCHQYNKFKVQLEDEHGREYNTEEVLARMDKKPFEKQWIRDILKTEKIRFSPDPIGFRLLESEINYEAEMDILHDIRKKCLKALLTILTPHQKDCVERFYYDSQTAEEIDEELGIDKQSVWGCVRMARGRMKKYWQLGFFLVAFNSDHFYDVKHSFEKEIWKPINREGIDVLVSNYCRVMRINHCHRHDFIIMPRLYKDEGFGRYQLPFSGSRKTWKVSILKLLIEHFNDEELPTFYERL